jgi:hypothetical protein
MTGQLASPSIGLELALSFALLQHGIITLESDLVFQHHPSSLVYVGDLAKSIEL